MINRDHVIYILILALANACTTILYFSQMYLLYDYFSPEMVYLAIISFAYIAQGIGLLAFMGLFRLFPARAGSRYSLAGCLAALLPIAILSFVIESGQFLLFHLIVTNILIGYILGHCFVNIAAFIEKEHLGICWGIAYALGNVLSWMLSRIDPTFIAPYKIIPIICVVLGLCLILTTLSDSLPSDQEPAGLSLPEEGREYFLWIVAVIFLMSLIYTISSTDYSMIAESRVISSTFYTRCCYAVGLVVAGFIYSKSEQLEGILSLASIVYPIMAYVLLKQDFHICAMYCLSFFFLGFFAVYRSCVFITMGNADKKLLFLVPSGMLLSRFTEGFFTLANVQITRSEVGGFILAGILFVPLIIIFFLKAPVTTYKEVSEEDKLVDFAKMYSLTRREEEILTFIVNNATNGEIAASLTISESTARFHVSNILKKTQCKTRLDLIHQFKMTQSLPDNERKKYKQGCC